MILKILKYSFALLLISLCLPAKAQRDKATADTVPPQQCVRGIQYESKEAAAAAAAKADEGKLPWASSSLTGSTRDSSA